jgi:hypothetical protein
LGVEQTVIADLHGASVAEKEEVLGYWAVGQRWGLNRQADTPDPKEWTQWTTPEAWSRFQHYANSFAVMAPHGSEAFRTMATTMQANIEAIRSGGHTPGQYVHRRHGADIAGIELGYSDFAHTDDAMQQMAAADAERHQQALDAVQQQLRTLLGYQQ